jgi:hypothetical protein
VEEIFLVIGFVIAIVMIVAQCQLFTVARELRRVRELLEFAAVEKGILRPDQTHIEAQLKDYRAAHSQQN